MLPLRVAALSALFGISVAVVPLPAQTPTALDRIPIYAGATRQTDREAELASPGETLRTVRVYRVGAPIEDVVRFYQQRLQAREVPDEAESELANAAMDRLTPGQTTQVLLTLGRVNLAPSAFEEAAQPGGPTPAQLAAAMRAAYTRKRPPLRANTWLESAGLWWAAILANGERVQFNVSLEDVEGFEIQEPAYHHLTEIGINVQREGAEAAEEEEEPEELPPARPMAAPSAAELGVPLYPGAKFDGQISAQMSASDEEGIYYVYTSTDTPQQVTTFYQTRTGKKGITNEGGTMIAVKGEGLFAELGVTVQPNAGTYPAAVKTMLTIRKRR